MEAVRRAASGAVDTIRNSPLFRRKFGTYQRPENESEEEEERPISPDKDLTPFVQGVYFQVGAKGMAIDSHCCSKPLVVIWCRRRSVAECSYARLRLASMEP